MKQLLWEFKLRDLLRWWQAVQGANDQGPGRWFRFLSKRPGGGVAAGLPEMEMVAGPVIITGQSRMGRLLSCTF